MRPSPARHALAVAALVAGGALVIGCAPDAMRPCNSDDDCLRRELCTDGFCGDLGSDPEVGDASPATSIASPGLAIHGELLLRGGEPDPNVEPEPTPEPDPTPDPNPVGELPADWLDPGLLRRALVTIRTVPGVVTERLADVPVMVELSAAALGADFLVAARERVVFATRGGELLAAELDADRGDRMFFWVRHDVDARVERTAPDELFVYAGGDTSLALPSSREVWAGYFGVYHLDAPRDVLQPDATGARAAHNEDDGAETVPCRVGACVFFDGTDDRLVVPSAFPELAGAVTATISATVRLVNVDDAFIAVWSTADRNRSRFYLGTDGQGVPQAAVRAQDASPTVHVAEGGPALAPGVEHTLDAVLDMAAGTIALFVDGQLRATDTFASPGALSSAASAAAAIGAASGAAAVYELDGRVDEVRISGRQRSADFVRVDAASRAGQLATVALDR